MRGIKPTAETIEKAIADYQAGMPMKAIGAKYGMCRGWMYFVLKRAGIEARPASKPISYTLDHHYFDVIDSHEKACILGFIWADGCLASTDGRSTHLRITLNSKDEDHLCWINTAMKNTRPISVTSRFSVLIAYHPQIVAGLLKQGIYPRKSSTIGFPTPEQVPDEYLSSFILGVFEGDGSIGITHKTGYANICGTESFCKWLQSLIRERLNIQSSITYAPTKAGPPLARISVGGNLQILRFMEWLYSKAPHRMERKHAKYLAIRSLYDENMRRIVGPEERLRITESRRKTRASWTMSEASKAKLGRPVRFHLKRPNGQIVCGLGVNPFCSAEKSICTASVFKLISGKRSRIKGWTLATAEEIAAFETQQAA